MLTFAIGLFWAAAAVGVKVFVCRGASCLPFTMEELESCKLTFALAAAAGVFWEADVVLVFTF